MPALPSPTGILSSRSGLLRFFATRPDAPRLSDPAEVARSYRIRRWVTFLGAMLGYALFYTTRLSLSVAKKPLIDANVATAAELGTIGSMLLLGYAVGKVVNGFLADRAHVGRLMGVGLVVSALLNIVFGFSSGVAFFAGLWFCNGWFQSLGATPSIVGLSHWFSHRERGSRYAIWSSAHSLGEGLTFALTANLAAAWGWRSAFWGPGALCVVAGLAIMLVVHDRPQTYGLPSIAEHRGETVTTEAPIGRQQIRMLRNPYVWILSLASALFYMCRYGVNNWLTLYLQDVKAYSLPEAGALMSALTAAGLVGTIAVGVLSDLLFKARRGPIVTLNGVLGIASLAALYLVPPGHPWTDRAALIGCGFANGGLLVVLGGLAVVDICPKGASGAAVGVLGFCAYLGAAIQDQVTGTLVEAGKQVVGTTVTHDFSAPFTYWIAALVVSMLLSSVLWWVEPGSS